MTDERSERQARDAEFFRRSVDALVRARSVLSPPVRALFFAVAVAALGFGLRGLLPDLGPRLVVLYPSVALAALVGGALAGSAATLLTAALAALFLFEPYRTFAVARDSDLISLLNFAATGLLISAFVSLDGEIMSRFLHGDRERTREERRSRSMIDVLHEGVILFSPEGRVIAANPSAERILGFAPGALVADSRAFGSWRLLAEDGTPMSPADYPAVRVMTSGRPVTDLVVGVPVGDRVVWLLNSAKPMVDTATGAIEGVVVSFIDVTERRSLTSAVKQGRAHLQSVFEALQEGVMAFDPTGRAVSCNPSAERILKRRTDQLIGGKGFLAHGRTVVREDHGEFPVEERPIRRALATGETSRDVVAGIKDEEGTTWINVNAVPVFDDRSAELVAVVSSFADITERRQRELEVAEGKAHLASILAAVQVGILVLAPDGTVLSWNPTAERVLQVDGSQMRAIRNAFAERPLIREDGSALPRTEYPAVITLATGESVHGAVVGAPVPGGHVWLLVNSEPIRDPVSGSIRAAVISIDDISEAIRSRRQIEESRARFASIVDSALDAVISVDDEMRVVLFNNVAEKIFGVPAAEVLGGSIDRFVPERRRAAHHAGFHMFGASGRPHRQIDPLDPPTAVRADGEEFPIEASVSKSVIDGRPLFTIVLRDITERLAAERTDAQLAAVVRASPDAILKVSIEGRIETWNEAATEIFGYGAEEAIGQPIGFLSFPDRPVGGTEIYRRVLAGETVRQDVVRRHKDGQAIEVRSAASPLRDSTGRVVAGVAVLSDITERVQAMRRLAVRDEQLRQTLDAAGLGVWWIEVDTGIVHSDQRSRALLTTSEAEAIESLAERFVEEDRGRILELRSLDCDITTGRHLVVRRRNAVGVLSWFALTASRQARDGGGEEVWGTVQDITEARRAEESAQRHEASRRLEALGRMSGGIAHDLNNLLTVISGNLQLLEMAPHSEMAARWITEALKASESGATLNNRLLTFARQRRLDPAPVDLEMVVGSMSDMLHRAVGPKIEITMVFDEAAGRVRVDRAEIENAVVNLVLNARDAMPDGGRIRIETRRASFDATELPPDVDSETGEFVRLTISDTGHGMPSDVRAQAFEPFFTTKAGGRGSGLGLATLHGFVRQMGGFVTLYSEVERGTAVNVYLPSCEAETPERASVASVAPPRGNGEHILLVDDNPEVRNVTRERLEALGYRVTCAGDADEASKIVASGEPIDLVFTDVVMPGDRSGIALARDLRKSDPKWRILICSGFAADLIAGKREQLPAFPFLSKPYSYAELADAVAAALRV